MNKKEKYINYVVEDLVKNTEIDHDQETIKFPFHSHSSLFFNYLYLLPSSFFSNYIKEKYGAHSEEIEIIWDQYKERIESLYKK